MLLCDYSLSCAASSHNQKKTPTIHSQNYQRFKDVPGAGIEPAWTCIHWCLRPARLPIPPPGLISIEAAKVIIFRYTIHCGQNLFQF